LDTILREIAEFVALFCGLATVIAVAVGALETLVKAVRSAAQLGRPEVKKALWVGFAGWILLALEFALAADIAETAISPTWDEIGKLAAIAGIRTLLNFFLERDLEVIAAKSRDSDDG
jgi:uncharacterized membrane protein